MIPELLEGTASLAAGAALMWTGSRMERAAVTASTPDTEPTEPEEGTDEMVQRYRLRIFDGQYEVLHENRFVVNVDLESPTMNAILDRQMVALVELATIANEPMDRPVMKVCDLATGKPLIDWVG